MMRESVGEVFQRTVSAVDKDAPLIRTPTIRSPLGVQWIVPSSAANSVVFSDGTAATSTT
jgi:hypothetical protein